MVFPDSPRSRTVRPRFERSPAEALSWPRLPWRGHATEIAHASDGSTTTTAPDGTTTTRQSGPDPRFGMAAPLSEELTIETPGGLLFERSQSRSVSVDSETGALESQTDTITTNGRTSTVAFDGSTGEVTTTTAAGRLLTDTLDARGRLVETEVDGLAPVSLAYDGAGRLASLAQGTGASERLVSFAYDADGNLASVTDPLLREVSFTYDGAGRVTEQTLPDGRSIQFSYDERGNLTSLTPPGQPAHVFRYTARDQEAEYEPPAVSASDPRTVFTYNADEDLTRVDRPDGKTIELAYDEGGRLEAVTTPRGTTTQSYDPATGNLSTITAPGGETLDFAYDGSLVTDTSWTGTVSGTVSRTFDDDFRVASQTVAGSTTASFAYDPDGLLTGAGAMTLTRDPLNGLRTGTTLDQVSTSRSYNAFGELARDGASVSGSSLYTNTYTRDALGRIVEETETIQGETTVFAYDYDAAGLLVEVREDGAVTEAYSYDANGSRLARTTPEGTESGTYDAQDRLQSFGGVTYTQNAAGDRTSKTETETGETTSYEYDALGNLVQVDLPDGRTIDYVIDGRNRRVGKKVDGSLVQGFLYQDPLNPVAEFDGAGNVEARFVYGSRPNVPAYMLKDGTLYRFVSDHLGSVRLVVNAATGAVAQRLDYDAFGRVTQDTNPGFQPFGFAGGIYDADTGLVRFGARDYDPEVGRWTVKDPIRFAAGEVGLLVYVSNDPLNSIDPLGLFNPTRALASLGNAASRFRLSSGLM